MGSDQRLHELLLHWQALRKQGRVLTAEELCRDCPELLDEVRRRLHAMETIEPAGERPAANTPTLATPATLPGVAPEPESPAGPGPTIPGYEILRQLGRGGMGVVYQARQTTLGRLVALKMILAGAHAAPDQRRRFRTEAEAAARLEHPNIVHVFEVGEQDHCPYLVLELVDGPCLADVSLYLTVPPPPMDAAVFVEQLARAVHYAHQRGIIHRDLKPANILLQRKAESDAARSERGFRIADFEPKITDFGLAKQLNADQASTQTGEVIGTPSYMAPEQAAVKIGAIGPGADVYALGTILYELLTGVPPFQGQTTWDTISQVLGSEPVPPSSRNPQVPRDLETICLKCLEKAPAKRYATALALADDLRRFKRDEPIMARPISWVERGGKWVRRRPALAGLLAVSLASLVVLTVGSLVAALQLHRRGQALEAQVRANQQALIRLNVSNGHHYLDDDDEYGSLIWFTRALTLEPDEARRQVHRLRIGCVLHSCPRLVQLWFHEDRVTDVSFSPDGRWILTASADHTAQVWDAVTGSPRFTEPLRQAHPILRAAYSPDGLRIVTAGEDGTGQVWNAETGGKVATLLGHRGPIRDARFSPDSRRIVTAGADRTARLWDAADGTPMGVPLEHGGAVVHASFHPDRQQVLTASSDGLGRIWQLGSGAAAVAARLQHDGPLTDACFDRAGKQVATASADQTARLWNAQTGQPLTEPLQHLGVVLCVAFGPDGSRLATASADLSAEVWDTTTGRRRVPALRHYSAVIRVAFSPDGTRVLTGSDDNTARVWDARIGRPMSPPLTHSGSVRQVCFSRDGRRVATAAVTARVYDLVPQPSPVPALQHDGIVRQATFSPDGGHVLTASEDRTARLWDAKTGQELAVLRGHTGAVGCAVFSPNGQRIVTASADGTARIWSATVDRRSGPESSPSAPAALLTLRGHQGPVHRAAFSPDGKLVVTAGADGTARVWDSASGKLVSDLVSHGEGSSDVVDAVFSPDGRRVATASTDRTARLWDPVTGGQVGKTMNHEGAVLRVGFRFDGLQLVTASADGTARLWDAASGEPLPQPALRQAGPILDACFSPDGTRILTSSDDNTARIWSDDNGDLVIPAMRHFGRVVTARFGAEGNRVATASADNTARVWDASTGAPLTPPLWHHGWGRVTDAAFSPTGNRVVTASADRTAMIWELPSTSWPAEDLERLAELLGGCRIGADAGSLVPLNRAELRQRWEDLHRRYPGEL
jgi:WD40 repeat protein